ncbi:DUF885 domain-containing protein [Gallaecimonas sp. GXIMD4217]|uniref:DUF885 domain-containing protein n=1 Tax=Gallaecimonas sp. GXIMD4217 TaxID=3131927 RepID=UPI00311AE67A
MVSKKLLVGAAVSLALAGCSQNIQAPQAPVAQLQMQGQSQALQALVDEFIPALWEQYPTWALYVGYYRHAGELPIPNAEGRARQLAFADTWLKRFDAIDASQLPASEQIDLKLIQNQLRGIRFGINELKSWQWNPAQYNVAGVLARLLNEEFAPEAERLGLMIGHLEQVPAYYAAARASIHNPTLVHTSLAIGQNQGAFSVLNQALLDRVAGSALSAADKLRFESAYWQAKAAIQSHVRWLEALKGRLEKEGARSFRLGEALYEQKFANDIQSGLTARQMYHKALADKEQVLGEMIKLTDQLWPKYFPGQAQPADQRQAVRTLIQHLSVKHVDRDDFVPAIKAQIPELEAFIRAKDLLTLDPSKPLVVRETPQYMRGFAGASISAPGPYDSGANTYYNVTPLDGMSDAQAESYLREYNHWILQVLNIHEAIPGHYTQLVYSNQSPSLVKSLFGNGAMVEGWAVYTERMMLEAGYGDFEPELWLMYYKWNLRVICNTILDYSLHVLGMTEEEALDLLMNDAFQEEAEARGKWKRATLSQVQLTSYYSGFREIYDLREELKARQGDAFDLKAFHEQFLSYGSAPVRDIRTLMLSQ